jgi:hypothetical protein
MIPIFTSHYSLGESILTLEAKPAEGGPESIINIVKEHKMGRCVLVESKMDGFFEAYKNLEKVGAELFFGLKVIICKDHEDKSEVHFVQEHYGYITHFTFSGVNNGWSAVPSAYIW